jgi:hypothetical protein
VDGDETAAAFAVIEEVGKLPGVTFNSETALDVGKAVELSNLKSQICRNALQVWNELRGDGVFPQRDQVTPRRLAPFLRSVTLYELVNGGEDFQRRVMGDATARIFGVSPVGNRANLNTMSAGMGDVVCRLNIAVAKRRAPLALRGWLKRAEGDLVFHETVLLPLGSKGGEVSHILAVADYGTSFTEAIEPEF